MRGWLQIFRPALFECFPRGEEREAVFASVLETLRPLCDSRGRWWADYVRLRFHAVRPAG
jgi:hypothetical protein